MKEKRKGPIGRAAGLAGGVAATVRRLQREREPRILVYDETGYARLVQPNGRGHESLQDAAERMVALVALAEADAKPRRARVTEGAEEARPRRARSDDGAGSAKKTRRSESADKAKKPRRSASAGGAKTPGRTGAGSARKPGRSGSAGARKARRSPREDDA